MFRLLQVSLSSILLIFFLTSCATLAPKSFSEFSEGEWQAKALVNDKRANKRGLVNLKIKAIDNKAMRIDVKSTFGTHVASFLMNDAGVEYLNITEKTVVRAKNSKNVLRDLMKIAIEPQVLYNVFFDRKIEDANWNCTFESEVIQKCKDKRGTSISWVSREGIKRNIEIESSTGSVHLNLYEFEKKISEPEKAFTLKVPSTFQIKYL